MRRLFSLITVVFVLFGCNSVYKENIEAADIAFEEGNFEDALTYYKTALKEKPDETDIKAKVSLLTDYKILQENMSEQKWNEASNLANAILKNDETVPSLQENVEQSLVTIEDNKEKEKIFTNELKQIEKLINNDDIDEASSKLAKLESDAKSSALKKDFDNLSSKLDKAEEKRLTEKKIQLKNDYLAEFDEFENKAQEEIDLSYSKADSNAVTNNIIHENTEQWDIYMNEVYQLLKENMSDAEFDKLKKKQKDWLHNKENLLDEATKMASGGTAGIQNKAWIDYDETKNQCYYLIENYL